MEPTKADRRASDAEQARSGEFNDNFHPGRRKTDLRNSDGLSSIAPAGVPADADSVTPKPTFNMPAKIMQPVVVGTRPEAIKMVPLILEMKKSSLYEPYVISTGQHHGMVEEIFNLAGIESDVTLWAGSRRASLNERVMSVAQRFEDVMVERFDMDATPEERLTLIGQGRFPGSVFVHGDTSSAMAAALSAFHLQLPVVHVEAGLRTGGRTPYPEEMNRQIITCLAHWHFAPTSKNLENLIREDIPADIIFVTGNTGIDALRWASQLNVPFGDPKLDELVATDRKIVVVTAHRRENWGAGLAGISEGVARLAAAHPDATFVVPVHPNPAVAEVIHGRLDDVENAMLVEPLGYAEFARLLGRCVIAITDSGGIQEEAPALGKPVLVTRESTERGEGVAEGTLRLVGTDPDKIFNEGHLLLSDEAAYQQMSMALNPYGDGRASERIVAAMENLLIGGPPPAQFGAGYTREAVISSAGYELDEVEVSLQEQEGRAIGDESRPVTDEEIVDPLTLLES